ncbi:hypothetical protein [Flavobacterium limi]|uniref:Uncharacterized protein n=1 Tax=Flavobacterium limi TaxID=2045105 RepID=A0ABQ1TRJ0_9FLAO|nr:hypothetical protein [Flavobacterium limi]GGE99806.1 hypothetical protein GCM10011518_06530 [Flavobacterium limi]
MKIEDLNLDYYSDFLGEGEIRFYANSKNIFFKRNIQENPNGSTTYIQSTQGQNDIYYFSMWEGYFYFLIFELSTHLGILDLPTYIKNYNSCLGWKWDDVADIITNEEIDWSIDIFSMTLAKMNGGLKKDWNFECVLDLIIFLKFVRENNMELRIALE